MLKIYLCEDHTPQLKQYQTYIENAILFRDEPITFEYGASNPYDLLKYLEKQERKDMGLYFINIDLGCDTMTGLQLANEIRKRDPRGFLVFITFHSEMSFLVFQYGVEAMDYILKDVSETVRERIEINIQRAYERYVNSYMGQAERIALKTGGREIFLNTNDLIYIDSSVAPHKLEFCTRLERIVTYGSLTQIVKILPDNFCRCYKSFIVNVNYIKELDSVMREIRLENGFTCPVSLQYLKKIRKELERF